jgi:Tc5 transposase DNA-binding domain
MERRGCPPQPSMVTNMANLLLAQRDPTQSPTTVNINWVHSFIKRQPTLKTRFSRRLTYSRAKCEDPAIIQGFFEDLERLKIKYGITNKDIYNFDETSFSMGIVATAKVICSSDHTGKPSLIQPGNRE